MVGDMRKHGAGSRGPRSEAHEAPGVAPADHNPQKQLQTTELQQRVTAAETERDKAKQQLNR